MTPEKPHFTLGTLPPPIREAIAALEQRVGIDPGQRGVGELVQWGSLERAALALQGATRVGLLSGFYIPDAEAAESDGPPGVLCLSAALRRLGTETVTVTDRLCAPLFEALQVSPLMCVELDQYEEAGLSHVVSCERVGRAADGAYYNMRGRDISAWTPPVDGWMLKASAAGLPTIGIGDGGNETGMGLVAEQVKRDVPNGEKIACVVPADHLIVAGVANWGGWALSAALGLLVGQNLLPSAKAVTDELQALLAAGAVDGVTRRSEMTVDGLPLALSLEVLADLHAIVEHTLALP